MSFLVVTKRGTLAMESHCRFYFKLNNNMWHQWVNGVLGLWIIASPFLGFTAEGMTTNLVIVGIAVALLSFLGAIQTSAMKEHEREWQQTHRHA